MEKGGSVYIMSNKNRTVLYIGVTKDLPTRIYQHRHESGSSSTKPGSTKPGSTKPGSTKLGSTKLAFTKRYNCHDLVYFENFHSVEEAIA